MSQPTEKNQQVQILVTGLGVLILLILTIKVYEVANVLCPSDGMLDQSSGALGFAAVASQGYARNPNVADGFSNSRISGMAGIDQGPTFWGPTNYDDGAFSVAASQNQNYYTGNSPYLGEVQGTDYGYSSGSASVNPTVWNDKLANMEGLKNTRISGNTGLRVRRLGMEDRAIKDQYYSSPNQGAVVSSTILSVDNNGNAVVAPLSPY